MNFIRTTATDKILTLRKRIRGIAGGSSASKTISILLWLIHHAQTHENLIISVVSHTFPHLKRGAIRDFLTIMESPAINYMDDNWNKSDYIYTFESGSKIEFFSTDQVGKVRGPRRDILFLNEANNINLETFNQLEIRTNKIIWMDWNPVTEFWFYTDILNKRDDVDFLILTYKDNEALASEIVRSLELRKNNKNWWRVYGEGQLGILEGRIYTDWKNDIEEIPHEARLIRYGLDFGYSNDPAAIVGVYEYNGGYILDEILYRKGMSNKDLADVLKNEPQALVMADSAEPKSIEEINQYGISILGAIKGSDSVNYGIQYVQDQRISVTKRSLNLWKEYNGYMWMTDKEGKTINEPQGFQNDLLDAIRYALVSNKPTEDEIDLPDDTKQLFNEGFY